MFDEFINGVETDMVDEVVFGATTLRLGVNTTMVVFTISTGERERERERENTSLLTCKLQPFSVISKVSPASGCKLTHTNERE